MGWPVVAFALAGAAQFLARRARHRRRLRAAAGAARTAGAGVARAAGPRFSRLQSDACRTRKRRWRSSTGSIRWRAASARSTRSSSMPDGVSRSAQHRRVRVPRKPARLRPGLEPGGRAGGRARRRRLRPRGNRGADRVAGSARSGSSTGRVERAEALARDLGGPGGATRISAHRWDAREDGARRRGSACQHDEPRHDRRAGAGYRSGATAASPPLSSISSMCRSTRRCWPRRGGAAIAPSTGSACCCIRGGRASRRGSERRCG